MIPPCAEITIAVESDIVHIRQAVREASAALGFGLTDTTRIVTAASELARNAYKYAGGGVVHLRPLERQEALGLELVFEDHGPGIPDPAQVLRDGYSTSGGLGMGLPGARRLMDEMELDSEVGRGTRILIRKWVRA